MKILLAFLLLLTTACASVDKNYAAALAAHQSSTQAMAAARQEQVRQMGLIAQSGDATSKAVAVMAMAMIPMPVAEIPRPPESDAYKWASLVLPAVTTLGTGYYMYRLGVTQSDNARDTSISANNAFLGMGNAIATAGAAGYPFIQAPGPVTTTTTTNTNTYTNSYNTTRNCNAGSGGAATTTAGAGGSANC